MLQQIASHIVLRADQLEEILHALKDASLDIRESLHTFLGTTVLSTISSVKICVSSLLDNLRRYPQVSGANNVVQRNHKNNNMNQK